VASHLVPLPHFCRLGTLQALLRHCDVELFESVAMRAAVTALWDRLHPRVYLQMAAYAALVALYTGFAVACVGGGLPLSSRGDFDSQQEAFFRGMVAALIINGWFTIKEGVSFVSDMSGYVRDPWNGLQVAAHGLVFASFACYVEGADETTQRVLGSYTVLVLYLSVLHFLKCFKRTSFLIEMLVQILKDMLPFLLILFIVITGVTFAIVVVENRVGTLDGDPEAYWHFTSALFKVSAGE
jgi:hypothetical protein